MSYHIDLTDLTPIAEVHDQILHLLFLDSPTLPLRLSKPLYRHFLPKIYSHLTVDSSNVHQILSGLDSKKGFKAQALSFVEGLKIGVDDDDWSSLRSALHDALLIPNLPSPLFPRLEHIHLGYCLFKPYGGIERMFEALLPSYIPPPCHVSFDLALHHLDIDHTQQDYVRDYNLATMRRLTNFMLVFFHEQSAYHVTFRLFEPASLNVPKPPTQEAQEVKPYREAFWVLHHSPIPHLDRFMLGEWLVPRLLRPSGSSEAVREELERYFAEGMEDRFGMVYGKDAGGYANRYNVWFLEEEEDVDENESDDGYSTPVWNKNKSTCGFSLSAIRIMRWESCQRPSPKTSRSSNNVTPKPPSSAQPFEISTLNPIAEVYDLVLEHLASIEPVKTLQLSRYHYSKALPLVYHDLSIHQSNTASAFWGTQPLTTSKREAFSHVKELYLSFDQCECQPCFGSWQEECQKNTLHYALKNFFSLSPTPSPTPFPNLRRLHLNQELWAPGHFLWVIWNSIFKTLPPELEVILHVDAPGVLRMPSGRVRQLFMTVNTRGLVWEWDAPQSDSRSFYRHCTTKPAVKRMVWRVTGEQFSHLDVQAIYLNHTVLFQPFPEASSPEEEDQALQEALGESLRDMKSKWNHRFPQLKYLDVDERYGVDIQRVVDSK
ncbi:hypothetical protein IAR50_005411 [Cryptococcus sp. DSM 104548]